MSKNWSAQEAAVELGVSPLYIYKLLKAAGVKRTKSIFIIDEATMKRLKAMRAGRAAA